MSKTTSSTALQSVSKGLSDAAATLTEALATGVSEAKVLPDSTTRAIIEFINKAKTYFAEYSDTLSSTERGRKIGTGIKNLGFVEAGYTSAKANQGLMPKYLTMPAYTEDMEDFDRKRTLYMALQQFTQEASDSMLAAGDIAYRDTLEYYNTLKEAARQQVPGAETEYKMLAKFFKRSKPSTDQPTEAEVERDVRSLLHGTKEGKIVIENEQPSVSRGKREVLDVVHSGHSAFRDVIDAQAKQ